MKTSNPIPDHACGKPLVRLTAHSQNTAIGRRIRKALKKMVHQFLQASAGSWQNFGHCSDAQVQVPGSESAMFSCSLRNVRIMWQHSFEDLIPRLILLVEGTGGKCCLDLGHSGFQVWVFLQSTQATLVAAILWRRLRLITKLHFGLGGNFKIVAARARGNSRCSNGGRKHSRWWMTFGTQWRWDRLRTAS